MSGLARFLVGFRSGYQKQREMRAVAKAQITESPVKRSTAFVVILLTVLVVVVFAYWITTLPDVSADALEARMMGLAKMLIGVAIATGAFWRFRRR